MSFDAYDCIVIISVINMGIMLTETLARFFAARVPIPTPILI